MSAKSITYSLTIRHSQFIISISIRSSHKIKKVSGYVRNHNHPCFVDQTTDSQNMMGKSMRQSRT